MTFDRAFQPIVVDGKVIFGSSVDGKVTALDITNGKTVWTFATEGPVRFAPAAWKDQLFVASDDGFLYALSSTTGELRWKHRGGPNAAAILGNERMISKWPARGGPVVADDMVYFAAGIWPSDGIFLYALDAKSGSVVWRNDDSGAIYMPQPHGGASAESGVSAQGYLVVSGDKLFVPTGRAVPAAFDRKTGKFLYFHLQKFGHNGGTQTMAIGDTFYNDGIGFNATSGAKVASLGGGQLAATDDGFATANAGVVSTMKWVEVEKPDRKGKLQKTRVLQSLQKFKGVATGGGLAFAGGKLISGGKGQIDIIDLASKRRATTLKVDGLAEGLAVSEGSLIVSTDLGAIYCFNATNNAKPAMLFQTVAAVTDDNSEKDRLFARAAEEILGLAKLNGGYCLDLECGDGRLALELARRSELRIVAIDSDPAAVQRARARLDAAGVLGSQVMVHLRDPQNPQLPKYFANLIVSERSVSAGKSISLTATVRHMQRPYGGMVCTGAPGKMEIDVRPKLAGAGEWTHQYANAGNTLNSDDELLSGQLGMLWFRDVAFDVPQRHGRAPAPLFSDGRLIHEGINGLVCIDAYNGHEIWRYDIPGVLKAYNGDELMGVAGTGGNLCLQDGNVYLRDKNRCLKIDAASGVLVNEFETPVTIDGKPGIWGYIACVDGTLFGTVADSSHVVTYRYRATTGDMNSLLTESKSFFAMDSTTGQLKWRYDAEESIRHNAIAIDDGLVFLIDRKQAVFDRVKRSKEKVHPEGILLALDAQTGNRAWKNDIDIYGTSLAVSGRHHTLLMSYQPTRFRLDSEVGGRLGVFNSLDGKLLWEVKASYESRPMINDRTIYVQGGSWDLISGEPKSFPFKRSYGCGILAGARDLMLFRSATLGYFDFTGKQKTANYGGIRPGCWVNALPAGGIVLVPDATAGCRCSYLNKSWMALEPNVVPLLGR
jgi:outer membrane protein assembly factor BamB